MDKNQAKTIIKDTFESRFDKLKFKRFIINLLNIKFSMITDLGVTFNTNEIPNTYQPFIDSFEKIAEYKSGKDKIDILSIKLKKETSVERARTMQRNFVAWYLRGGCDGELKDAALAAFTSPDENDWRFSLIKMDYSLEDDKKGKPKISEKMTPAKRWSFLVGANEKSHTAQSQLIDIVARDNKDITLGQLEEAFNVEMVTKEFFKKYRELFLNTKETLDNIVSKYNNVKLDFESKNIDTVDFSKKLLGQIVFLYFLQKKGWFGVARDAEWGTGPKNFLRDLFEGKHGQYKNFYNDILEPLFYEALRNDRSYDDDYYRLFNCKIPFLNGGLFDPINNYDWVHTDINLPNELFSNSDLAEEGDKGTGILDIFDRYNFTVKEDEPLEKEVAVDPELLGKIYEKFNSIRQDNFDEYKNTIILKRKDLEKKFNKEYGVYYTPRHIVNYMCRKSLINFLEDELKGCLLKEEIELIFSTTEKNEEFEKKIRKNAELIDNKLKEIKICDPAIGSGAFPVEIMHEIVKVRSYLSKYLGDIKKNNYNLKRECIENCIYGVDIDAGATEISKLRLWLSLIVDEDDIKKIKPLPNLDYKIVCGDSLLGIERNLLNQEIFTKIESLKRILINETNPTNKQEYKTKIDKLISGVTDGNKKFDFKIYFSEVFHDEKGFDIIITNPPYVSTKTIKKEQQKIYKKIYNISDDLYNYFFQKSFQIVGNNGIITFISSDTYITIQSKLNLRKLFQRNRIIELIRTGNVFEEPMVEPVIIILKKEDTRSKDYILTFKDAIDDFKNPKNYYVNISFYRTVTNNVFFIPTEFNLRIYKSYNSIIRGLMEKWWRYISTSKNILKYDSILQEYRQSLKPGDITLLGFITNGGVGLQTGDNGKYIGVIKGSKIAENVGRNRPLKLLEAVNSYNIKKLNNFNSKDKITTYLSNRSEIEIRILFDNLKEKYGRDIFGQGYIFRVIDKSEIANIDNLTEDEKQNGIGYNNPHYVLYDKGDKGGNRWYLETPFYIDWSKRSVENLKTDPKARWQGYKFFFKEGFCWILTLNESSIYQKSRIKEKGVHDVNAMTLVPIVNTITPKYLVCLFNSYFIYHFKFNFINNSSAFQINDARQLPIIIPNKGYLDVFDEIFNSAFEIKRMQFKEEISLKDSSEELTKIQKRLDEMVYRLYSL